MSPEMALSTLCWTEEAQSLKLSGTGQIYKFMYASFSQGIPKVDKFGVENLLQDNLALTIRS